MAFCPAIYNVAVRIEQQIVTKKLEDVKKSGRPCLCHGSCSRTGSVFKTHKTQLLAGWGTFN